MTKVPTYKTYDHTKKNIISTKKHTLDMKNTTKVQKKNMIKIPKS